MSPDRALGLFLVDLALLIFLARWIGILLSRLGQPPVMGEILAGILLGPSLLGAVAPDAVAQLFPREAMSLLSGVGNLGLVLFAFLIGLEINRPAVRRRLGPLVKICLGSFLLPFAAGVLIVAPLAPAGSGWPASLFFGVVFSVTAVPVLARILADEGLSRTALGTMSLAAAGILDLVGWLLLTVALTLAAGDGAGDVLRTVFMFLVFLAFVTRAGVPLLRIGLARLGSTEAITRLSIVVAAILGCAGATQLIGLHSLIGALVLGVAFPREELDHLLGTARRELSSLTRAALLPVYFAVAGMGVEVSSFGRGELLELLGLVALATVTKVIGSMVGARWAGLSWRDGLPLGVLMNSRGLVEIVILQIGLAAGLLDRTFYSELILVALIATFMTGPAIRRLRTRSIGRLWSELGLGTGQADSSLAAEKTLPVRSF